MADFLDIRDVAADELRQIIESARLMKKKRTGRPKGDLDEELALKGHVVALVFQKPSTRTRISFDVGIRQLGGESLVLSGSELHLGKGESIPDTARVLSRMVDMVMIRTFKESDLREFAAHCDVPVINGLTDNSHPCQVMADIMTFEEFRGSIKGKRVAWLGAGSNVCASMLHAAGQFGFNITFSGPDSMRPDQSSVDFAISKGSEVAFESDPQRAVRDSHLVATDAWVSMHERDSLGKNRIKELCPYQVNSRILAEAGSDALFMHCLPAHRGEEATSDVLDGPNSVIFDEAENRLHVQKAIMRWCLGR